MKTIVRIFVLTFALAASVAPAWAADCWHETTPAEARQAALNNQRRRAQLARWERTNWTRKDYEIALKVIAAYNPGILGQDDYGPYTRRDYEKATIIKRVYERAHPNEKH